MKALPERPLVSARRRAALERLRKDTERDPPRRLVEAVRDELAVDLSTSYGGVPIAHPFGKASGQLSCTLAQVRDDIASGIAFVVLKTVIAETPGGSRTMAAWVTPDTKMRVERCQSECGRSGWTVTWKGRGWHGTLEDYAGLVADAVALGIAARVPVIPSAKYHLPGHDEPYRTEEYEHTTSMLLRAWERAGAPGRMLLEKDFSPTLAGDRLAADAGDVLRWLRDVPGLIVSAAPERVRLGVKVMNALFDDDFQVNMLRTLAEEAERSPAFLVVFNRLYDPNRHVAFGGWDLSDRNLRILDRANEEGLALPPLSATGNIQSGRMMLEYARRGCENGQLHTFFQLPNRAYTARGGTRTARALHTLLLHPEEGLVPWLWHAHAVGLIEEDGGVIHFRHVVRRAPR